MLSLNAMIRLFIVWVFGIGLRSYGPFFFISETICTKRRKKTMPIRSPNNFFFCSSCFYFALCVCFISSWKGEGLEMVFCLKNRKCTHVANVRACVIWMIRDIFFLVRHHIQMKYCRWERTTSFQLNTPYLYKFFQICGNLHHIFVHSVSLFRFTEIIMVEKKVLQKGNIESQSGSVYTENYM